MQTAGPHHASYIRISGVGTGDLYFAKALQAFLDTQYLGTDVKYHWNKPPPPPTSAGTLFKPKPQPQLRFLSPTPSLCILPLTIQNSVVLFSDQSIPFVFLLSFCSHSPLSSTVLSCAFNLLSKALLMPPSLGTWSAPSTTSPLSQSP